MHERLRDSERATALELSRLPDCRMRASAVKELEGIQLQQADSLREATAARDRVESELKMLRETHFRAQAELGPHLR